MLEVKNVFKEIEHTGWTLSRVLDDFDNKAFVIAYEKHLEKFSGDFAHHISANPFNIPYDYQVWGIGWNILWRYYKHYYLTKEYPEWFPVEQLCDALAFNLGRHPGSNLSFVSGVGPHKPIPAFGMNLADYSYIPGGHYSGTSMVCR